MFRRGDWIIATKRNSKGDGSWMNYALEVVNQTTTHIVYLHQYGLIPGIMAMVDVIDSGFILAEPCIIEATKKMRYWEGTQIVQAAPTRKKKIRKTFECWVNAYPNGNSSIYPSRERADLMACMDRIGGRAFHFVGQYTVEE